MSCNTFWGHRDCMVVGFTTIYAMMCKAKLIAIRSRPFLSDNMSECKDGVLTIGCVQFNKQANKQTNKKSLINKEYRMGNQKWTIQTDNIWQRR